MVTEGLLVGEPLSRPFPVADAELNGNVVTVKANRHTKAYLENARSPAQNMVQQPRSLLVSISACMTSRRAHRGSFVTFRFQAT
ncbi:hypothetical protein AJ87_37645 [Rhizobium yanglingense]|nr:hypothetical protein AJ87_37645 [Rhizobium yanglingense]